MPSVNINTLKIFLNYNLLIKNFCISDFFIFIIFIMDLFIGEVVIWGKEIYRNRYLLSINIIINNK
jgi:hypothetical protein